MELLTLEQWDTATVEQRNEWLNEGRRLTDEAAKELKERLDETSGKRRKKIRAR